MAQLELCQVEGMIGMRIAKIKKNDVVNGEGVMTSIFVQGCPHHCKGCFNKETWNFEGGTEFKTEDFDKILNMLDANGVKRNLAILGGEPLAEENYSDVLELCRYIKKKRPETIIYLWSGYTLEEFTSKHGFDILEPLNFLIDGRFEEDKKDITLKLRGSSNQRIINISEYIKNRRK